MAYRGLIAGLGNPGMKYERSRHNLGFAFIDALLGLASKQGQVEELNGKKFQSELWAVSLPNGAGTWLAAKPMTFMNDSGKAIRPLLDWHNLTPDQLVVAHDELDLPPGALRFKFGGGLAGHNGLASITQWLGSRDYYRLRMGVGKPEFRDETINWVLGRPDAAQQAKIASAMPFALETFCIFAKSGLNQAESYAHAALKKIEAGEKPAAENIS